jgi:cytochrome c oxidase cbb3-type subunit 2
MALNFLQRHKMVERNITLLAILAFGAVTIGGLVEIAPLFWIDNTIEKVQGMRPYTPLEQAGRDIYIREGCYLCHSQMIRPFRDEVERYGHYSLAAESMYDHPFQWGSKRTGPDLARIGGKYTNDWHVRHLTNPRDVVPESIMPGYKFLHRPLAADDVVAKLKTLRVVGVPYTDDDIANAKADLVAQASDGANTEALLQRYPKASVGKKDKASEQVTEMDALVAYLQVLGTMVDFSTMKPEAIR